MKTAHKSDSWTYSACCTRIIFQKSKRRLAFICVSDCWRYLYLQAEVTNSWTPAQPQCTSVMLIMCGFFFFLQDHVREICETACGVLMVFIVLLTSPITFLTPLHLEVQILCRNPAIFPPFISVSRLSLSLPLFPCVWHRFHLFFVPYLEGAQAGEFIILTHRV